MNPNRNILRFTLDYPGRGRYLRVKPGLPLIIDIHVRDRNNKYKNPTGKLTASAWSYTGRYDVRRIPNENRIEVPVVPDPGQLGRFKLEWVPIERKYEVSIFYNKQLIGHREPFLLKVLVDKPISNPSNPMCHMNLFSLFFLKPTDTHSLHP